MSDTKHATCEICGKSKSFGNGSHADLMRTPILELARRENPDLTATSFICRDDVNRLRAEHITKLLEDEKGEISELEQDVLKSIHEHEILTANVNKEFEQAMSFGDRLSDKIAEFGGSWRFIISFGVVLFGWIVLNAVMLAHKPFDPYPFILLNLILSCLAAIQAPVIMMSQNRQEAKDRLRSENDYRVNLKAELEIRILNERVEHLLKRQWQRLLEIQEIQTELMREIARERITRMTTKIPVTPDTPPAFPEIR